MNTQNIQEMRAIRPGTTEYASVHYWLKSNYGKATHCEMKSCVGFSKKFEWSLKHGKQYERKRANFWQLCKKCHALYDVTEHTRKIAREKNKNTYLTHCHRGHPFVKGSYLETGGGKWRMCKRCHRIADDAYKLKKRNERTKIEGGVL